MRGSYLIDRLAQVLDRERDIALDHARILPTAKPHQFGLATALHHEPAGPMVAPIVNVEPGVARVPLVRRAWLGSGAGGADHPVIVQFIDTALGARPDQLQLGI